MAAADSVAQIRDDWETLDLPRRKVLCPVGVGVASVGVGVAALATDPGGGAWELG